MDGELQKALEEIREKELRTRKRVKLYTVIPVLVAAFVFAVLAWQAIRLERRKNATAIELEELQSSTDNARAHLMETTRALDEAKQALETVRASLSETNGVQKAVQELNSALRTTDAAGAGRWILISGDKSLAEAQFEAQRAQKLGYAITGIYFRQNSYRTLIEFPTEADARAALPGIRARLSPDAYLRDVTKWCLHPQQREGYFSCAE